MKTSYLICVTIFLFIMGCSAQQAAETASEEQEPTEGQEPIIGQPQEELPQEPQENIVVEVPEEEPEPAKEEEKADNIVYIKQRNFDPEDITIYKGESVAWVTNAEKISNNQPRRIACYDNTGYRIFLGERLTENGKKSEFKFEKAGEYLCQEMVFGLRGHVKVKSIARPLITGAAVGVLTETNFLPLMIVIGLIFLFISYSKREKFF